MSISSSPQTDSVTYSYCNSEKSKEEQEAHNVKSLFFPDAFASSKYVTEDELQYILTIVLVAIIYRLQIGNRMIGDKSYKWKYRAIANMLTIGKLDMPLNTLPRPGFETNEEKLKQTEQENLEIEEYHKRFVGTQLFKVRRNSYKKLSTFMKPLVDKQTDIVEWTLNYIVLHTSTIEQDSSDGWDIAKMALSHIYNITNRGGYIENNVNKIKTNCINKDYYPKDFVGPFKLKVSLS